MPLVSIKLVEEAFTEKQKRDVAARLTDVTIASEESEALLGWPGYSSKNSAATAGASAVSRPSTNQSDGHPLPLESRVPGHQRHRPLVRAYPAGTPPRYQRPLGPHRMKSGSSLLFNDESSNRDAAHCRLLGVLRR